MHHPVPLRNMVRNMLSGCGASCQIFPKMALGDCATMRRIFIHISHSVIVFSDFLP